MLFHRESGLLLHPTSLPGAHGMGEIGAQALAWVDALAAMGQRLWQVLPLGPTGFRDSPYQSLSTFAASPLLIELQSLVDDGLLEGSALAAAPAFPADHVDFGAVIPWRRSLLRLVTDAFATRASAALRQSLEAYSRRHAEWLDDWALFDALKQAHGGGSWTTWPATLRDRDPAALTEARADLGPAVEAAKILQYLFDRQWAQVRLRAHARGVRLIGDIPIFVAHDSADVWAHRDLFQLDGAGVPTVVAGVPPDYFSETGQRWGNPLYDWPAHAASDHAWWVARVRRALELVDAVRIDHFRGFAAAWEIPAAEPTAVRGRWVPGPGAELFHVLRRELGELPIVAEDLGLITADVEDLRDQLGFPGMRVLQFAFDGDPANPHLPANYVDNCVAYTGTHDNDTLASWLAGREAAARAPREAARERARFRRWLGRARRRAGVDHVWAAIELLLESRASAVILPLQDVLGLGSAARMNAPGTAEGNWAWRFRWEDFGRGVEDRLALAVRGAGRSC